jgi:hypothetical protein
VNPAVCPANVGVVVVNCSFVLVCVLKVGVGVVKPPVKLVYGYTVYV